MRRVGWIQRFAAMGAGAQSSVPGLYAWGVTVAPCAWMHGASGGARLFAAAALAALLLGPVVGDRFGDRFRVQLFWTFVLGSGLAWSTAPAAISFPRIDAQRGLAGMLGWALFAITWSAPALRGQPEVAHLLEQDSQSMDEVQHRVGGRIIIGAMLSAALQAAGWTAATLERALLVRFVGLAAGLSIIGAATELAISRHRPRVVWKGLHGDGGTRAAVGARTRGRLRRATGPLLLLGILALGALLFGFRG
ncbi:MAG: hypothetical protein M3O36_03120 [Myxococcota bacterium]|nr:hypothetical protein [Myxococcota bacterium]